MTTHRSSPDGSGSNKLLWAGLAIVVVIVLVMGAALIWMQSRPQEPRFAVLPASEAPPANTTPVLASASPEAASSAAPLAPATANKDPLVDTPKPRSVQLRASEPAVSRAPERAASKLDAIEGDTPPDPKR